MAANPIIDAIRQAALSRGVDPAAALAVSSMEGLSGNVGDNGTSFGPFQLHQGGALPTGLANPQQWSSSPAGINYAMNHIASVAKGLHGREAISAIVNQFERPLNPGAEISGALSKYGQFSGAPASTPQAPPQMPQQAVTATLAKASAQPGAPNYVADMLNTLKAAGFDVSAYAGLGNLVQSTLPPMRQAAQPVKPQIRPGMALDQVFPGASTPGLKMTPQLLVGVKRAVANQLPVAAMTSEGGLHDTMGLPGFPAHDYFAKAGSPVVAPISGKVIKLSGHDPSLGPVEGPHGPLGWSVYIQDGKGNIYYLTHMGSRGVKLGQTLKAGQVIGTVANYAQYGTPSHIHMGVHRAQ